MSASVGYSKFIIHGFARDVTPPSSYDTSRPAVEPYITIPCTKCFCSIHKGTFYAIRNVPRTEDGEMVRDTANALTSIVCENCSDSVPELLLLVI